MDSEYIRLSSVDEIVNPNGACIICRKSGQHKECEKIFIENRHLNDIKIQKAKEKNRKLEQEFLRKYAISKSFGTVSSESKVELERVKNLIIRTFGDIHSYAEDKVIESNGWWYIPYFYIGLTGYIVEKGSDAIYSLGSGYGNYLTAINKYINGEIDEHNS